MSGSKRQANEVAGETRPQQLGRCPLPISALVER
jgi:hypothetical protein